MLLWMSDKSCRELMPAEISDEEKAIEGRRTGLVGRIKMRMGNKAKEGGVALVEKARESGAQI